MYLSLQLHLVEVCILAALGDVVETLYYVSTYIVIVIAFHCKCSGMNFWSHFFASSPCLERHGNAPKRTTIRPLHKLCMPWAGMNHSIETHLETLQLQKAPCLAHSVELLLICWFFLRLPPGLAVDWLSASLPWSKHMSVSSVSYYSWTSSWDPASEPLLQLYYLGCTLADEHPSATQFAVFLRQTTWLRCVLNNFIWGCWETHTLELFEWQLEIFPVNGWRPANVLARLWLLRLLAAEEIKDEKVNLETCYVTSFTGGKQWV